MPEGDWYCPDCLKKMKYRCLLQPDYVCDRVYKRSGTGSGKERSTVHVRRGGVHGESSPVPFGGNPIFDEGVRLRLRNEQ